MDFNCNLLVSVVIGGGYHFCINVLSATGFGKRIIVVVDLDESWCDGFIIRVWR